MVQTALASTKINADESANLKEHSSDRIIQVSRKIRLAARFSSREKSSSKGLLVLMHGWLGDYYSSYIVRSSNYFFDRGFDILRINLRDHGDTHHLNKDAFNGSLLPETYEAVRKGARALKAKKVYLAGFSLGGNFVLRMALRHSSGGPGIPNLKGCVAVSPAIHPHSATLMMDNKPFLRRYFLDKWMKALRQKSDAFPEFDLEPVKKARSVMELTEKIIPLHTPFSGVDEYFKSYTLLDDTFKKLRVPVTILTSADDPIIDHEDFRRLHSTRFLKVSIQKYGGHNGFIQSFGMDSWYNKVMEKVFDG